MDANIAVIGGQCLTMDVLQQVEDLKTFGYTPVHRRFGGDFAFKSPDGRLVPEEDFEAEINKLLGNDDG